MGDALRFSVVIPTHARPDDLARCLAALADQELRPAEVIVACASSDRASAAVVRRFPDVILETITAPSNLRGMEAAACRATGDVVCFTDDDARPRSDWLARMAHHFADDRVGALGGRDVIPALEPQSDVPVGVLTRWGKLIGNHHLGTGGARDVDILKGVNMAMRRNVLAFPEGLSGGATTDHFEIAMSLWVKARGLRVVYDPAVTVDHSPGRRIGTSRSSTRWGHNAAAAFNLTFSVISLRPDLVVRRAVYGILVGDRACPGIARAMVAVIQRDAPLLMRAPASITGQCRALVLVASRRRLGMRPLANVPQTTTLDR